MATRSLAKIENLCLEQIIINRCQATISDKLTEMPLYNKFLRMSCGLVEDLRSFVTQRPAEQPQVSVSVTAELLERKCELLEREAELLQRKTELFKREAELLQRQAELLCSKLHQRQAELAQQQAEWTQREAELVELLSKRHRTNTKMEGK